MHLKLTKNSLVISHTISIQNLAEHVCIPTNFKCIKTYKYKDKHIYI
jgi:hypothetical protein